MKRYPHHAVKYCIWVAVVTMSIVGPICQAQTGTMDREYVFNPEQIKATLDCATLPLIEKINNSQLLDQFDQVNELIGSREIDKPRLLKALNSLQAEMTNFTQDWEEVMDPLWRGQEAIGQTIDKVRGLLARASSGEPSEKTKQSLRQYDKRLSDLATAIKKEVNAERRARLKQMFANVLSLRKLTEQMGGIDLGTAQETMYVQIIDSLSNLEMALTNSTFQVEKVRIILGGQAEFINNYSELLGGLIEAEGFVQAFNSLNGAGQGLVGLDATLDDFQEKVQTFKNGMATMVERTTSSINAQSAQMAQVSEFDDQDIDRQIEAYASK